MFSHHVFLSTNLNVSFADFGSKSFTFSAWKWLRFGSSMVRVDRKNHLGHKGTATTRRIVECEWKNIRSGCATTWVEYIRQLRSRSRSRSRTTYFSNISRRKMSSPSQPSFTQHPSADPVKARTGGEQGGVSTGSPLSSFVAKKNFIIVSFWIFRTAVTVTRMFTVHCG